jgi:hypothetical protein
MATIHDLIASTPAAGESVSVGGMEISVRPVSMLELLHIVRRFPRLKDLLFGDGSEQTVLDVVVEAGPEAVAAVLACATGAPGDRDVERGIAALPDEHLIELLAATIRLTMPGGIEGFFGKFARLAQAAGLAAEPRNAAAVGTN